MNTSENGPRGATAANVILAASVYPQDELLRVIPMDTGSNRAADFAAQLADSTEAAYSTEADLVADAEGPAAAAGKFRLRRTGGDCKVRGFDVESQVLANIALEVAQATVSSA